MKLLTNEIRQRLPKLYATEHDRDPVAQVRFFATWSDWNWYATEFDGEDIFFGIIHGFCWEWGYFSLAELQSVPGLLGIGDGIERDLYFEPTPVSQIAPQECLSK